MVIFVEQNSGVTDGHFSLVYPDPDKQLTCGRDSSCDFSATTEKKLSREQCAFTVHKDAIEIKNLSDKKPTFINKVEMEKDRAQRFPFSSTDIGDLTYHLTFQHKIKFNFTIGVRHFLMWTGSKSLLATSDPQTGDYHEVPQIVDGQEVPAQIGALKGLVEDEFKSPNTMKICKHPLGDDDVSGTNSNTVMANMILYDDQEDDLLIDERSVLAVLLGLNFRTKNMIAEMMDSSWKKKHEFPALNTEQFVPKRVPDLLVPYLNANGKTKRVWPKLLKGYQVRVVLTEGVGNWRFDEEHFGYSERECLNKVIERMGGELLCQNLGNNIYETDEEKIAALDGTNRKILCLGCDNIARGEWEKHVIREAKKRFPDWETIDRPENAEIFKKVVSQDEDQIIDIDALAKEMYTVTVKGKSYYKPTKCWLTPLTKFYETFLAVNDSEESAQVAMSNLACDTTELIERSTRQLGFEKMQCDLKGTKTRAKIKKAKWDEYYRKVAEYERRKAEKAKYDRYMARIKKREEEAAMKLKMQRSIERKAVEKAKLEQGREQEERAKAREAGKKSYLKNKAAGLRSPQSPILGTTPSDTQQTEKTPSDTQQTEKTDSSDLKISTIDLKAGTPDKVVCANSGFSEQDTKPQQHVECVIEFLDIPSPMPVPMEIDDFTKIVACATNDTHEMQTSTEENEKAPNSDSKVSPQLLTDCKSIAASMHGADDAIPDGSAAPLQSSDDSAMKSIARFNTCHEAGDDIDMEDIFGSPVKNEQLDFSNAMQFGSQVTITTSQLLKSTVKKPELSEETQVDITVGLIEPRNIDEETIIEPVADSGGFGMDVEKTDAASVSLKNDVKQFAEGYIADLVWKISTTTQELTFAELDSSAVGMNAINTSTIIKADSHSAPSRKFNVFAKTNLNASPFRAGFGGKLSAPCSVPAKRFGLDKTFLNRTAPCSTGTNTISKELEKSVADMNNESSNSLMNKTRRNSAGAVARFLNKKETVSPEKSNSPNSALPPNTLKSKLKSADFSRQKTGIGSATSKKSYEDFLKDVNEDAQFSNEPYNNKRKEASRRHREFKAENPGLFEKTNVSKRPRRQSRGPHENRKDSTSKKSEAPLFEPSESNDAVFMDDNSSSCTDSGDGIDSENRLSTVKAVANSSTKLALVDQRRDALKKFNHNRKRPATVVGENPGQLPEKFRISSRENDTCGSESESGRDMGQAGQKDASIDEDEIADLNDQMGNESDDDDLTDNNFADQNPTPQPVVEEYPSPLTQDKLEEALQLLDDCQGDPDSRTHETTSYRIELHNSDMVKLAPQIWVNDNIVSLYKDIIVDKMVNGGADSDFIIWQTSFWQLLSGYHVQGDEPAYDYKQVMRWTKKKKWDIFAKKVMLVPMSDGYHWSLGCVEFTTKKIYHFCSFHGDGATFKTFILNYLADEHKNKKEKEIGPDNWQNEWTYVRPSEAPMFIPKQDNVDDCGVFCMLYMLFLARNFNAGQDVEKATFPFNQDVMEQWRLRIMMELKKVELLPDP